MDSTFANWKQGNDHVTVLCTVVVMSLLIFNDLCRNMEILAKHIDNYVFYAL